MRLYRDAICAHGTNISLITVDDRTKIGDTVNNKLQNILDSNTYEVLGIVDDLSHKDRKRVDDIIKIIQREKAKIDIMRDNVIDGNRNRRDFIKQEMAFFKMYNDAKKSIIDICINSKSDIKGVTIHTTSDMISTIVDDFMKELKKEEHR